MEIFDERKYYETLKFVLFKAGNEIYPEAEIIMENSLNNGVYGKIKNIGRIDEKVIEKIKNRMDKIIIQDIPINMVCSDIEMLKRRSPIIKRKDIRKLLDNTGLISMKEYEMAGYYDYFHEELYPRTGMIYLYEIYAYEDGFILKMPTASEPDKLPPYINNPKLAKVFKESATWGGIMGISYVGALNEKILDGKIEELIRINEILHHRKLSKVADEIIKNREIKLITVAGPSSSGKTTFSKKLRLHLLAAEIHPIVISLDNYYIGRENIPLDEYGKKDYETIDGLDIELLNKNLQGLIGGEEVEIPEYNFITGVREEKGTKMRLPKNGVIVIEGIHGLNEKLTHSIPKGNKFKIYISCLTQLNIDAHNRIYTSDVRKIRRIVRDSLSRGASAEVTLSMWKAVRKGEEKYIFPYQEDADIIYDSSLFYELSILKTFAEKELIKVKVNSEYYNESKRLLKFLEYFLPVETKMVPDDSILKEFIGGSYFYKY